MKYGLYPKIAWTSIRKNGRFYTPYMLTCMGMIMMYYIISFLNTSSVLLSIPGGSTMQMILGMGKGVISVFAVIFLFYTNSFLIRRRKREFGLYNILGMGKGNLALILVWETLIIAVLSLAGGLIFGIAFSKFGELVMVNILHGNVTFTLSLGMDSIWYTFSMFSVIFFLILLNTLRQIQLSNPIELLHSEQAGEKPPKENWILAAAGVIILGVAYYIAVTIDDPVSAMMMFFVAVIMVIVATYLLFIAGSVVICRILQKNKNYYYKTNHFVSISSMVYRMKRNGAGLATICILCTMVLVMVSSTVCLYIGTEDVMRSRYPRNINLDVTVNEAAQMESDNIEKIQQLVETIVEENGQIMDDVLNYRLSSLAGYVQEDHILTDISSVEASGSAIYPDVWQIFLISLEDYNRLMGQKETLEPGEVLLYTTKANYEESTITFGNMDAWKVKKVVSDFVDNGVDTMQVIPSMYIFFSDYYEIMEELKELKNSKGNSVLAYHWLYGFDLDSSNEEQIVLQEKIENAIEENGFFVENTKTEENEESESGQKSGIKDIQIEGVAEARTDFYGLYGGLFFLGILLGVVFVFAAVLIMYYKQVSEGYEDQSRFEIMQKVGMTKKDIRKSINSQVLMVFFLPLLAAGIHLAFAFPMIQKMLQAFGLTNQELLIQVTIVCYLVFSLFYVVVYRITSKAYYNIVSGRKD